MCYPPSPEPPRRMRSARLTQAGLHFPRHQAPTPHAVVAAPSGPRTLTRQTVTGARPSRTSTHGPDTPTPRCSCRCAQYPMEGYRTTPPQPYHRHRRPQPAMPSIGCTRNRPNDAHPPCTEQKTTGTSPACSTKHELLDPSSGDTHSPRPNAPNTTPPKQNVPLQSSPPSPCSPTSPTICYTGVPDKHGRAMDASPD